MIEPDLNASSIQARALRINVIVFITMLLTTIASFVVRSQGNQDFTKTISPMAVMLLSLASMLLIRYGRVQLGSTILIGGMWLSAYGTTTQTTGIGLWLSIFAFLITSIIISQSVPSKLVVGGGINAFASITLVLLDLYWPYTRSSLPPPLDSIVPLIFIIGSLPSIYFVIRQFPNYSLLTKLFITNVLVVLGAVAGIVYFINSSTSKTVKNSIGEALYSTVDAQAVNTGNLFAQQLAMLEVYSLNTTFQSELEMYGERYAGEGDSIRLAEADEAWHTAEFAGPLVQQVLNNTLAQDLDLFRDKFRTYSDMLLVDQQGALVASTFYPEHYDQSGSVWWQVVKEGNIYIGDPDIDPISRVVAVGMAIPIHASVSDNVIGALYTVYSLSDLRSILLEAKYDLGETGELGLLLPENKFLDATTFSSTELSSAEVAALAKAKNRVYVITDFADTSQMVSRVDVRTTYNQSAIYDLGWSIVAQQKLQSDLEPVVEQRRGLLTLGLIALIVSSILVALFGRVLIRPVTDLIVSAQAISAGDLSVRASVRTRDEIGELAMTFNGMADEIQQIMSVLEGRIIERTAALETVIKVSRDISTILDQQELVAEVVNMIQQTFNYYHVHIYLTDDKSGDLIMAGGTGEAGLSMLSSGHRMLMGVGLVGRAAVNNETVLVADTLQNDDWQPNTLLPDTRSELAVPISFGEDEVLGVLDIQQDTVGGLGEEDLRLMQSVANQTAVALRNIRLYQRMQDQAAREATVNLIGQKIQAAVDVDSVLRIAARELGESLGARQTTVQISRKKG